MKTVWKILCAIGIHDIIIYEQWERINTKGRVKRRMIKSAKECLECDKLYYQIEPIYEDKL